MKQCKQEKRYYEERGITQRIRKKKSTIHTGTYENLASNRILNLIKTRNPPRGRRGRAGVASGGRENLRMVEG